MLLNVSLTGAPLTILLIVAAVALPVALALAWRRLPGRVGGAALRIGMIISCQAVAVLAAGIALNRAYLFYDSWDELLGHKGAAVRPPSPSPTRDSWCRRTAVKAGSAS